MATDPDEPATVSELVAARTVVDGLTGSVHPWAPPPGDRRARPGGRTRRAPRGRRRTRARRPFQCGRALYAASPWPKARWRRRTSRAGSTPGRRRTGGPGSVAHPPSHTSVPAAAPASTTTGSSHASRGENPHSSARSRSAAKLSTAAAMGDDRRAGRRGCVGRSPDTTPDQRATRAQRDRRGGRTGPDRGQMSPAAWCVPLRWSHSSAQRVPVERCTARQDPGRGRPRPGVPRSARSGPAGADGVDRRGRSSGTTPLAAPQ